MNKRRADELNNYIRIACDALEPSVLATPLMSHPLPNRPPKKLNEYFFIDRPRDNNPRLQYVKWLVRFCANQYKLDMPRIKVKFSNLGENKGGHIFSKNGIWYVEISVKYKWSDLCLAAIVSHEMAHVVLYLKKISIEPTHRNEELTDVVSCLAGFGYISLSIIAKRVNPLLLLFGIISTRSHQLGYLSEQEIKYILKKKSLISQKKPIVRFRKVLLSNSRQINCSACSVVIRAPERVGIIIISCPICHTKEKIDIRHS